jgi:dTMP kinase
MPSEAAVSRGVLLALEGIDGAGKSSLQRTLARSLRRKGWSVRVRREPADARLGAAAQRRGVSDPFASAILFTLDRAQARPRIESDLARGRIVLLDRSFYSTLAYQGSALDPAARAAIGRLQRSVALRPDRVLWLDLPVDAALARLPGRGRARAPLERRAILERVRRAYRALAEAPRWIRLDARSPPDVLAREAAARLGPWLERRMKPRRAGRPGGRRSRARADRPRL